MCYTFFQHLYVDNDELFHKLRNIIATQIPLNSSRDYPRWLTCFLFVSLRFNNKKWQKIVDEKYI